MVENKNTNINAYPTSQLIDTTNIGNTRGDGIPSQTQIDNFLAGIRNNKAAINLPLLPSPCSKKHTKGYTNSNFTNQPLTF